MLTEDVGVRQIAGEPPRRWFSDDYFDLIVWQAEGGLFAMQLCYDRRGDEHALVWHAERGYVHYRVDQGEIGSLRKATPMMMSDGQFELENLRKRFRRASGNLEPDLLRAIERIFDNFPS